MIIGGPRNQEDRIYFKYLYKQFHLKDYSQRIKFLDFIRDFEKKQYISTPLKKRRDPDKTRLVNSLFHQMSVVQRINKNNVNGL